MSDAEGERKKERDIEEKGGRKGERERERGRGQDKKNWGMRRS